MSTKMKVLATMGVVGVVGVVVTFLMLRRPHTDRGGLGVAQLSLPQVPAHAVMPPAEVGQKAAAWKVDAAAERARAEAERLRAEQARAATAERQAEQARLAQQRAEQRASEAERVLAQIERQAEQARLAQQQAEQRASEAERILAQNERQAEQRASEVERLRAQIERQAEQARLAEQQAERLRALIERRAGSATLAQQAAPRSSEAERLRAETEQQRQQLRQQLLQEFNLILETRDTARGLIVNLSDVLFDFNTYTLRPAAREKLAKISGIILSHPGLRLEVDGYPDSIGIDAYNQKLSEERADSVRRYLTQQDIAHENITARGFGKENPIALNDTTSGRQMNRRVELVISGDIIGH